jgi:hypothetical protein
MLTALAPLVLQTIVSTSAGVAIDSAVKMIVPIGIKALPAFGIKVGTAIATAYVAAKVGKIVETNVKEIVAIVNAPDAEEVPSTEDN